MQDSTIYPATSSHGTKVSCKTASEEVRSENYNNALLKEHMSTFDPPATEIQDSGGTLIPCRVDVCLPGIPDRLLPIPFDRVYSVKNKRIVVDCFEILNYTVQLLLDIASHLSPIEREKLGHPPGVYVHPATGLMVHSKERSFANFAMECILQQHNSTDPLVFSPSWPSVFFDEDGYPFFAESPSEAAEGNPLTSEPLASTSRLPVDPLPPSSASMDEKTLEGERILTEPPITFEKNPHHYIPTDKFQFLPEEPTQEYVPKRPKKRKHVSLQRPPDEYITLTLQRL
jgi:hypothetical protein